MSGRIPDRISVLFVCQHDLTGPSEKQVMGLAQHLTLRGHAVMLSLGGPVDTVRREGLLVLPGMELTEHRFTGRRLRPSDRNRVTEFAPTLIHALNSRVPTMAATVDYARATGAPVFVHFEDNEWSAWSGVPGESLHYRLGRHIRRLESWVHPSSWPHSTPRTRRWVRRRARGLDALTPELSAEVRRRMGRDCATLLPVSPLGREGVADNVGLSDSLRSLPLAIVTGTIYPFSLDDVLLGLASVAEVQRRGYALGYVHPGNVHTRIDPMELASRAGLAPGTFAFPGRVPYASISALLSRGTVLLQPGGPTEFNRLRLPSKLQAYLAAGVPTITFAAGFGSMLRNRDEVLKTYTDDPVELADRIEEILTDAVLRNGLAEGGPRAARRLFDPQSNVDALIAHYQAHLDCAAYRPGAA